MGYLSSCKATSSVSASNSELPKKPNNNEESSKSKPIKIQEFSYSDLEEATNGFSKQKLLGRGSHGLVYKGVLKSGRQVAVKKPSRGALISSSSNSENSSEVENEFDILSKLNSSRLVNLVGFTNNDSRGRLLVVEFMSNGTLYDVLHSDSSSSSSSSSSCPPPPPPPNWGRRVKLALQTAKAIDILHSSNPTVIHRDIKSANVLLDKNFNARLGDFGLALRCHADNYKLMSTPPAGTMGYLDPNYVTPDNLSTKTDVFSFGILLLEILSGRKAIDVMHSPPSIVDWAIPLIRRGKLLGIYDPRISPPKDPLVRKQLAVVAAKCVRNCRERRPTMKEVVHCLSGLTKLVPLHSWNGFTNPCMMVENVGKPVELKGKKLEIGMLDGGEVARMLKNSRRVHSDLGSRNNLMDLMNGHEGGELVFHGDGDDDGDGSESIKMSTSFRIGNDQVLARTSIRSRVRGKEKTGVPGLTRNHSIGEESSLCPKNDIVLGSISASHSPHHIT